MSHDVLAKIEILMEKVTELLEISRNFQGTLPPPNEIPPHRPGPTVHTFELKLMAGEGPGVRPDPDELAAIKARQRAAA